jgi:hypothetical protein
MSLSPELRRLLVDGPDSNDKRNGLLRFGGTATVRVQWRKHRAELMSSCEAGHRPWAFWMLDCGRRYRPPGEVGELKAIRDLDAYRSDSERRYVLKRLSEITDELRARRDLSRVA